MSLEILKMAIRNRTGVSFEYNKAGKVEGERFGDPYAVFIMKRRDGSESTKVHIYQTAGVSDSGQVLPSFRMFDLVELSDVEIQLGGKQFEIVDKYNPEWDGYGFVIEKV